MGRADVYLQPDAPDPVLSSTTIVEIARRHTTRATAVIGVDESGGEARVYLLDGDVLVKTQRPHRVRPRTSLVKEAFLLGRLAGPLGGRVPELFGHGLVETADGVVEYLVISRMPGQALIRNAQGGAARSKLVRQVGALLAELHAVTIETTTGTPRIPVDHHGRDLARRLESGFADLVELIAERRAQWSVSLSPEEVAAEALAMLPAAFTPVLLHSNPGPTHTFCTPDGSLTGLIDLATPI